LITFRAAVDKYGRSRHALVRLVRKGMVRTEKRKGRVLLDEVDLQALCAETASLVPLSRTAAEGRGRTRAYYYLSKLPCDQVRRIRNRIYLTEAGANMMKRLLSATREAQEPRSPRRPL
jgi:hypothetical protein